MIQSKNQNKVGALHTIEFVQQFAAERSRILDVGSGEGLLSSCLEAAGHLVTSIDKNIEAVSEAKKIGMNTICADFLHTKFDEPFDIVVMSRSLHHMHPISETVKRAKEVLKPGGLLVVEDFAAEIVDKPTALWFFGVRSMLEAAGQNQKSRGPKLDAGKIPNNPLDSWHQPTLVKHGVAKSTEMLDAVKAEFEIIHEARLHYLYRYFLEDVSEEQANAILDWERRLIECESIKKIGLRLVGRRTTDNGRRV